MVIASMISFSVAPWFRAPRTCLATASYSPWEAHTASEGPKLKEWSQSATAAAHCEEPKLEEQWRSTIGVTNRASSVESVLHFLLWTFVNVHEIA